MRVAALLVGFAVAVGVRVAAGGPDVARSVPAGLLFAACLLVLVAGDRTRVRVNRRAVALGLLGIVVVCVPVGLGQLIALRPLHPTTGFLGWALAVTVVAGAEELFLRGALYDAIDDAIAAPWLAIVIGAVCFALLHVPLYGWHVVPLDLAVGLVLGGLRAESGTPVAPAITHVGADLVGWFLR